jgi:hypothetical protein
MAIIHLPWRTRAWINGIGLGVWVTVKMDYQTFEINKDFTRFDLGLGLAF